MSSKGSTELFYFLITFVVVILQYAEAQQSKLFFKNDKLNTTELAAKYGYHMEAYEVTTEDGYILTMHHIPGKGRPILIIHPLADSSETWFLRGEKSLGVTLADRGYDLWFGDVRGNAYSRKHLYLDPDENEKEFWNFSFNEHGYYDLPAFIDFVLDKTGDEKLNAVAVSQGTTMFFVLGALRPDYNEKVNALVALAPVAYLNHLQPPLSTFIKVSPPAFTALEKLNVNELFGNTETGKLIRFICLKPVIGYTVCAVGVLFPLMGFDPAEYGPLFHYMAMKRFPQSTSLRNLEHFAQVSRRHSFAQYDYGPTGNMERYGEVTPPDYPLGNVTMPIVLICGQNDKLAPLEDVATLRVQLPNVLDQIVLERPQMNHLDFVWGKHMDEYLFPYIFDAIDKYF